MNSKYQIFVNPELSLILRTVIVDDMPWFDATHACYALDLDVDDIEDILDARNIRDMPKDTPYGMLTDEEVANLPDDCEIHGVTEETRPYVSEAGLFTLAFQAEDSKAVPFLQWVIQGILPEVKKAISCGLPVVKCECSPKHTEPAMNRNSALQETVDTLMENNTKLLCLVKELSSVLLAKS